MSMPVVSSANADQEIAEGNFPQIRHIKIPNVISGVPLDDIPACNWQAASPETVGDFTAVGYFFARKLYKELGVPVGLINSSWGGSMVETWISREAFERSAEFKDLFQKISFADIDAQNHKQYQTMVQELETMEGAITPVTSTASWNSASFDHSAWKQKALPLNFDQSGLAKFDGTIWFRKTVTLDKTGSSGAAMLNLGIIDDMDETYVNGTRVGGSNTYSIVRQYAVPAGVLKEGQNVIAIRVTDNNGNGGFFGNAPDLNFTVGNQIIPLAGDWAYKIEAVKKPVANPNSYPTLLFNSMIQPLIPFAMQGVLWYQGETNAERAHQYKTSFPMLIKDWRSRFKQGDFPFYFVQLASYSASNGNSNRGSSWAELREAQTATLSLPNTGMAVILDIGETTDIHPKNKQDVGLRLAAIALNKTYGKNTAFSGPVFKTMRVNGSNIVLSFSNADMGYFVKDAYGYIKGFEVAGANKKFYLSKAHIENGNIVVHADSVTAPIAVRYGWADDMPEANLYNKQGFPAVPFRTDSWPAITSNVKYRITHLY
jgi:sialate O-acetylesterase